MTEKEKAKELVDKFKFVHVDNMYLLSRNAHAKQCALIAVDEIINEIEQLRKPEYTTSIISYEKEENMDGYEKVTFWEK